MAQDFVIGIPLPCEIIRAVLAHPYAMPIPEGGKGKVPVIIADLKLGRAEVQKGAELCAGEGLVPGGQVRRVTVPEELCSWIESHSAGDSGRAIAG